MVDEPDGMMSNAAHRRMAAALPGLLAEVRGRRRRRQVRRVFAILLITGALVAAWPRASGDARHRVVDPVPDATGLVRATQGVQADSNAPWVIVPMDPTLLARCEVPTIVRAEWFVDDAGLQVLLQDAGLPPGLVRVEGRVFVDAAALD